MSGFFRIFRILLEVWVWVEGDLRWVKGKTGCHFLQTVVGSAS